MVNSKISGFVSIIKDNYKAAKNFSIQEPQICAGAIRTALETAVKLFWLKKYDKEPVWIINGKEEFNLYEAVKDSRFSSLFNEIIISDIHVIRKMCNDVLHGKEPFTVGVAQELLNRLEKCVEAIQSVIELNVITTPDSSSKTNDVAIEEKPIINYPIPTIPIITTNAATERRIFWDMFEQALDENGNPFYLASRDHYATINRKSANCNLCLSLDFLVQKEFFRIGIYIQDDIKTPHYDRLLLQKEEIEKALGFSPIWNNRGEKNPNTRRIEIQLPFMPYVRDDYERLIDLALPIILKYIEVFSIYLPDAFKENYQRGEKVMVNSIKVYNPLVRNVHKGYGGRAQAIYDECCKVFGWDSSKRYLFGLQQILYAEKATPEGYSPWFLPHNNWTETKGGNFFNEIYGDVIEEMWIKQKYGLYHDETTRVTFVKTKSGEYVFLGIYNPIKVEEKLLKEDIVNNKGKIVKHAGEKVWIKTYQSISDEYAQ